MIKSTVRARSVISTLIRSIRPVWLGIIDQGRLQVEGTPADLKASLGSESINIAFKSQGIADQAKEVLSGLASTIQADRETLRLYLAQAASAVPVVVQRLQQADLDPVAVTLAQPTLNDVFLQVIGQRLQD